MKKSLIILDRDGVLNRLIVDQEHGTIDSPLHPNQVEIFPWIPKTLANLHKAGFGLAIASNQPAWSKGKTTRGNLDAVHQKVIHLVESQGAKILSSHLCFHQSQDGCDCRKPKPGLLKMAFNQNPEYDRSESWMVGDGVTDIQAGQTVELKTAFLGPKKCDFCKIFDQGAQKPTFWGENLMEFSDFLLGSNCTG